MSTSPNKGVRDAGPAANSGSTAIPPSKAPSGTRHLSLMLVGAVALILLAAVWWLNHVKSGDIAAGEKGRRAFWGADAAVPVVVQTAQKGDIDLYQNGLGTVTPLANVTIRTQVSGQLTEIHFHEGQEVKKGDLLAVIDPRPYQLALEQSEGQILQAHAQLAQAQSDLARYETLSKQDSIALQQVDTQRALVSQYEGLVKTDQAAIDNAKLNLIYCHITSPINGRVGLRQVDAGNYVTPGDANGLVTLTEMKPISVIFTLPEGVYSRVAARLHAGATIPVDAYDSTQTKKIATGKLSAIDNQADTSTGTFRLRAIFSNEDEALFPNEFVNVRMLLDVDSGVIVIPTSAIEQGQKGTFVYVVAQGDTVNARPITLGPTQGERVAVTAGLAAGERVVVDGADRLKEGGRVTEQQEGAAAGAAPARRNGASGWTPDAKRAPGGAKSWQAKPARPASNGSS
jgi:multidrug efflux system membrane fusion protein